MIKKGIILSGGMGTRVGPVTKAISKQLIPIYDKPTIFYPLSILMLMNIKNILIIVNPYDEFQYKKLLGDGSEFGIKLSYIVQSKPKGLPDAFILGEKFIDKKPIVLILGDNFFHGSSLIDLLLNESKKFKKGSHIFTYPVKNPKAYGIAKKLKNKIIIEEKPKKPKSNKAITGLYFFDKNVVINSKKLKPSKRNELEIVDLLKIYNSKKILIITELGRGSAWLDTGTGDDILKASNYVNIVENRQYQKIACLEEIAFNKKWINRLQLKKIIKQHGKNNYSSYLENLLYEENK